MPDIAARVDRAKCLVVGADLDAVEDALGGDDLVGSHDEQQVVGGEDAVVGEDGEEGVLGEEGVAEVHQVSDGAVGGVCPPAGELEAVAGAFAFLE